MLTPKQEEKIEKLVEKTKEVFYDCLLPNGCLVAAPVQMPYFPSEAKNYFYCWPGRDLGFNITGALILGVDVYDKILAWIWERAEDYQVAREKWREGLIFKNYHPNGRINETEFQPDQTGTLLWAVAEYGRHNNPSNLHKQILQKSANGLCRVWQISYFKLPVEDLWEERLAHPRFKTNLTYTLATCSAGLEKAYEFFPHPTWRQKARQMRSLIEKKAFDKKEGCFLRRFGGTVAGDLNADASLLGLVWPFEIIDPSDTRVIKTLEKIEEKLVDERGVHRYQFDEYEGEMEGGELHFKQGAGAWPLLTFWLSIVESKMGDRHKAEKYFWLVLNQVNSDFLIPEQFFPQNDPRVGIKPLLWSHMMFVHAAHELGYI
jgi:GH15 family glucan-1,4-alpha-glucosidase